MHVDKESYTDSYGSRFDLQAEVRFGMGLMLWGKSVALVNGNIREKRTPAEKWFMYGSCSSERVGAVGRGMHFRCFGGR